MQINVQIHGQILINRDERRLNVITTNPLSNYWIQCRNSICWTLRALNKSNAGNTQTYEQYIRTQLIVLLNVVTQKGWNRIQSLSRGDTYFFHGPSGTTKNFGVVPDECKGMHHIDVKYQDQGSRFAKPPKPNVYSADLQTVPGIKTNAYILNGDLFENTVNVYLVEFDPPLNTKNVLERRGVVLGRSSKQQRKNRQLLNDKFGFWEFDNHKFFAMGSKAYKIGRNDELPLSDEYKVSFLFSDSHYINSEDIPISAEEQILNIFKRKAMKRAQFNNVCNVLVVHSMCFQIGLFLQYRFAMHGSTKTPINRLIHRMFMCCEQSICSLRSPCVFVKSMRPIPVGSKATVLSGYECSLRVNTLNGLHEGVFIADIASKLVSQVNVNAAIYRICENFGGNFSDPAFQNECRRQLQGKYFIMRYNNQSTRIEKLDFTQDENGTFELGQQKVTISYKDYVFKQYGLKAETKEMCVLCDQRGSAFLPQFAYLTLRSDECADDYDQILRVTNQPIAERLERVNNLVKILNKSESAASIERQKNGKNHKQKRRSPSPKDQQMKPDEKSMDVDDDGEEKKLQNGVKMGYNIEIDQQCIETDALRLHYPNFTYQAMIGGGGGYSQRGRGRGGYRGGRGGGTIGPKTVSLGDRNEFKWGGGQGTKGFLYDVRPIRNWCIVCDGYNKRAGDKLFEYWQMYTGMRRFDQRSGPIQTPKLIPINM